MTTLRDVDLLELQTLADELIEDRIVACGAFELAVRRFDAGSPADHDSSAHHLTRFYNVLEQLTNCRKGTKHGLLMKTIAGISGLSPRGST